MAELLRAGSAGRESQWTCGLHAPPPPESHGRKQPPAVRQGSEKPLALPELREEVRRRGRGGLGAGLGLDDPACSGTGLPSHWASVSPSV